MFGKIKEALSNSLTFILALFAGIAYLWFKERDLENKLEESKADGKIKDAKEDVKESDLKDDLAESEYNRVKHAYLDQHGPGGGNNND